MTQARQSGDAAAAKRTLSLARTLLTRGGTLESTGAGESVDRTKLADALERRIKMSAAAGSIPPALTAKAAAAEALASAESALGKTAAGASPTNLTDLELASLEAIIEVTGRPAMRYTDGQVQMPPDGLGDNDRWRVLIAIARSKINRASASVGRISLTVPSGLAEHVGTGWRAGDDLIVTNRHVLKELAANPGDPPASWTVDAAKQPVIDFAATDNATASQRFLLSRALYCAAEEGIDVAFLGASPGASALPPPLPLDWDSSAAGIEEGGNGGESPRFKGREVYLVGHPFRPRGSELIEAVFGAADGAKRWSPGLVVKMFPGQPLLDHDCSTLGGNSGSCVLTTERHAAIGIHVGGVEVDDLTGRGSANRAVAFHRLGAHRVAEILRAGRI